MKKVWKCEKGKKGGKGREAEKKTPVRSIKEHRIKESECDKTITKEENTMYRATNFYLNAMRDFFSLFILDHV